MIRQKPTSMKLLDVQIDITLGRLSRAESDGVDPCATVVLSKDDAAVRWLPTGRVGGLVRPSAGADDGTFAQTGSDTSIVKLGEHEGRDHQVVLQDEACPAGTETLRLGMALRGSGRVIHAGLDA